MVNERISKHNTTRNEPDKLFKRQLYINNNKHENNNCTYADTVGKRRNIRNSINKEFYVKYNLSYWIKRRIKLLFYHSVRRTNAYVNEKNEADVNFFLCTQSMLFLFLCMFNIIEKKPLKV